MTKTSTITVTYEPGGKDWGTYFVATAAGTMRSDSLGGIIRYMAGALGFTWAEAERRCDEARRHALAGSPTQLSMFS